MHQIKYLPSEQELEYIPYHYWEIWEGLPDVEFNKVKSGNGEALRHDMNGNYIWVPTLAHTAYKLNQDTIYLVMMHNNPLKKINAIWLEPKTDNLEDIIKIARKLNQREIEETIKKIKRKKELNQKDIDKLI